MRGQLMDLYWLAYLLTGDRERSVESVIETIDMRDAAKAPATFTTVSLPRPTARTDEAW